MKIINDRYHVTDGIAMFVELGCPSRFSEFQLHMHGQELGKLWTASAEAR